LKNIQFSFECNFEPKTNSIFFSKIQGASHMFDAVLALALERAYNPGGFYYDGGTYFNINENVTNFEFFEIVMLS